MLQEKLAQTFSYRKLICCNSNKTPTQPRIARTHTFEPWERAVYFAWFHFKHNILKVYSYFVSRATDVLLNMNVSIRSGWPHPSSCILPATVTCHMNCLPKTQRQTKTLSSTCSGAQGTMSTSTWHQPVTRRSLMYLCFCVCALLVVLNA